MRNYSVLLLIYSFLFISCSHLSKEEDYAIPAETHTKGYIKQNEYAVSIDDFLTLVGDESSVEDLICYPNASTPLLIAANFKDGGYILVSGDKRATPIVAFSDTEKISYTEETKWVFEDYSAPIEVIVKAETLNELMLDNLLFWEKIDNNTLEKNTANTKVFGQYRYVIRTTILTREAYLVGPLLETRWGQSNKTTNDYYWNYYCPWGDSTCTGAKCPVGCVAVAGGQLAYYLKGGDGVCITMPVTAGVYGYAQSYYQSFSDLQTTSYIDNMPLDYSCTDSSAIYHARVFLSYIGNQISMNYSASGSRAATSNIVGLLQRWGINSTYHNQHSFDETDVWDSIGNDTPVVVQGFRDSGSGHAWVIDGRKKVINVHLTYYYVTNELLTDDQIENLTMRNCNDYSEEIIPGGQFLHMNWGWNGLCDGWYASDNWTVADRSYNDNKAAVLIQ